MKSNKQKQPNKKNTALNEKIQRLSNGIKERSTTWSKTKSKSRQQEKIDLKKENME